MRSVALTLAGTMAFLVAVHCDPAKAEIPSVATLDASARASGNRKDIAVAVGDAIFATKWPVQVSQVSANEFESHLILGIRLWGVKFHGPVTRGQFVAQVASLIAKAFAAEPQAEEVDVWASVPIAVGKGVVVSGDLAKPTSRVVYSITVRRSEPAAKVAKRAAGTDGVYWDEDWAHLAFKKEA